jgi:SRSO17 transposase
VRRNRRSGELAFYRCYTPHPTPLAVLVRIAGRRWRIEEAFQASKGLCGLDQHQVRRWCSWDRWATLAMLAHAFLVVAALTQHTRHPPAHELIGVTCSTRLRVCSRCPDPASLSAGTAGRSLT